MSLFAAITYLRGGGAVSRVYRFGLWPFWPTRRFQTDRLLSIVELKRLPFYATAGESSFRNIQKVGAMRIPHPFLSQEFRHRRLNRHTFLFISLNLMTDRVTQTYLARAKARRYIEAAASDGYMLQQFGALLLAFN